MRARLRSKIVLGVALFVFTICLSLGLWAYFSYRAASNHVDEGIVHLRAAEEVFSGLWPIEEWDRQKLADLEEAYGELVFAEESFRAARSEIGPFQFLVPIGGILPGIGGDIRAASPLVDTAISISVAGQGAYNGLEPTFSLLEGGDNPKEIRGAEDLSREFISLLNDGCTLLVEARERLAEARELRTSVDESRLSERVAGYVSELDSKLPVLETAIDEVMELPGLLEGALGYEGRRTYLVLTHSVDELRPSGGLVVVYGEVVADQGCIDSDFMRPSRVPPSPTPPQVDEPIHIPAWWFRFERPEYVYWDSNWVADFPTAAEQAEWFYEEGGNVSEPLDGVIGIDLHGTQYILEVLGPVEDCYTGGEVNGQNLRDLYIAHMVEGGDRHEHFVCAVGESISDKLAELRADQILDLTDALLKGFRGKHIQVYFDDPDLQEIASERCWDGSISATGDDYLFLVDSCRQGGKTSMMVNKSVEYVVEVGDDGTLAANATIQYYYDEEMWENDPASRYGIAKETYLNQLRLYVAKTGMWQTTQGGEDATRIVSEKDRKAFVNKVAVTLQASATISYDYTTLNGVAQEDDTYYYRLFVQKQAAALPYELSVTVVLPDGTEVLSADPESCSIDGNTVRFSASIDSDHSFEVAFR